MKRFGLWVALLSAARQGPGLRDGRPAAGRWPADTAEPLRSSFRTPARVLPLPAGVTLQADLAYGPAPGQRLDVYQPPRAVGAPILVVVHGGGWRRGDKAAPESIAHKVEHWTRKGWIVVSTNYRLDPGVSPVQQSQDVARAMAFVAGHAPGWGARSDQMVLMGHSAGAHLVTLLTVGPSPVIRACGPAQWRATVALDSAAFDVVEIMRRPHLGLYDAAFGDDVRTWEENSPPHRLRGPLAAPMLSLCASGRPAACRQGQAFAAKANRIGGSVTLFEVDASHRAINESVGADGPCTHRIDAFLRQRGAIS